MQLSAQLAVTCHHTCNSSKEQYTVSEQTRHKETWGISLPVTVPVISLDHTYFLHSIYFLVLPLILFPGVCQA